MRPPLPPTYTGELSGQNRRIASLEKKSIPTATRSKFAAELRIFSATRDTTVLAVEVKDYYPLIRLPYVRFGAYWSDWYTPENPVTFTELAVGGVRPEAHTEFRPLPDRFRVSIEIADPSSELRTPVLNGEAQFTDVEPYLPGDDLPNHDINTKTVAEFTIPYPPESTSNPMLVRLPTPVLVTSKQKIRLVRWHQIWDPATIAPDNPEFGTRFPQGPGGLGFSRSYELYGHITDVPWSLVGESVRPTTAEVRSFAGVFKHNPELGDVA